MRLRLVVGDAGCTPADGKDVYVTGRGGSSRSVEIVVRLHLDLTYGGKVVPVSPMDSPVQGLRIGPSSTPFTQGVRAWMNDLQARGRVPATLAQYEEQINRIARDQGWDSTADVSYESAVEWLAERRRGGWQGATYKRAATALRSFGKSLSKAKLTAGNVLEHIESAGIVSGDGSRPLEVWEAQAIIKAARDSERASRRCRGTPALFWTFLCLTGFRYREAQTCRWRQVDLDEGVIWSDPATTKNKTRMPVGLCPEMIQMLRDHRANIIECPDDRRVFDMVPKRATWHDHREKAGVTLNDRSGSPATPHSCRKAFHVWLGAAGVPETVVEAQMRHVDSVGRKSYNRPFIETLREAAKKLPVLNEKSPGFLVAPRPGGRYLAPVTRAGSSDPQSGHTMVTPTHSTSTTIEGVAPRIPDADGTSPCDNGEATFGAAPSIAADLAPLGPEVPTCTPGLNGPNRNNEAADLLESLARFLRGGGAA